MLIESREIRRLAVLQRPPRFHIERRNEQLEFTADQAYRVTVRQQISVPVLDNESASPTRLLLPLGTFPKARRADLVVRDPDQAVLPVMLRRDSAVVIAALFLASWSDKLRTVANPSDHDPARRLLFRALWASLIGIVGAPEEVAFLHLRRLADTLSQVRFALRAGLLKDELSELLRTNEFWTELFALTRTTTLFTQMVGEPGATYVIETSHTDKLEYESFGRLPRLHRILPWFGMTPYSTSRLVANVGYPRSLWVGTSVPEGVEVLRYFWAERRNTKTSPLTSDPPTAEEGVIQGNRATIGWRRERPRDSDPYLVTQTQMAPSAAVVMAGALAMIAVFVSAYIFEGIPARSNTTVMLAQRLSASPASLPRSRRRSPGDSRIAAKRSRAGSREGRGSSSDSSRRRVRFLPSL